MAKIALYADPHWAQYSSVVRMRGQKYSTRLENLIKSINWVNQVADSEHCDEIFCLGDFFDRDDLNAEEISALSEVDIKKHWFLLGNHEIFSNEYSSNKIFDKPINKPKYFPEWNLLSLPYQKEEHRKSIKQIKQDLNITKDDIIILSHNDISGIQYGGYLSKEGYSLEEVEQECSLYINGHLHNQQLVLNSPKCRVLNLGNLTGQNFSEDAMKYSHCMGVLDTDLKVVDLINNPYSLQFYKEDIIDVDQLNLLLERLSKCPETSIVSLKISQDLLPNAAELLDKCLFKRISISSNQNYSNHEFIKKVQEVDHISKFKTFIREKYDGEVDMVILNEELDTL